MNDRAQMAFLGRNHRKALAEVKAHLIAKDAARACACAVGLVGAVFKNVFHKVEILFHALQYG